MLIEGSQRIFSWGHVYPLFRWVVFFLFFFGGGVELKIYFKYVMWGIKLKGLRTQADISYSQGYDDDGDYSKDDNIKEDNNKGDMNDKDNLL